jgi:hypothetical protein
MSFDYHIVAAVLGVTLALCSDSIYVYGAIRNTIKPHAFTWLGWGIISGIVAAAQLFSNAGATVWVTASIAVMCLLVALFAFRQGKSYLLPSDWVFLVGSMCAVSLWVFTRQPLSAVVVILVADTLAFVPMLRKAYRKPEEDSASAFALSVLRNVFALIALQSFVLVNWIYPAFILFSDGSFVVLLLVRRYQLKH